MTRLKDGTSERLEAEAGGEGEGGDEEEAGERFDVDVEEAGAEQVGEAERLESKEDEGHREIHTKLSKAPSLALGPGKALTD